MKIKSKKKNKRRKRKRKRLKKYKTQHTIRTNKNQRKIRGKIWS